jgi:hypothetical protein
MSDTINDHMRLDERSLALHRLVARKLLANPALLGKAKENLRRWQQTLQNSSLNEWHRVLSQPIDQVASLLVERSERATRLRQSSPFSGILTDAERREIYESYSTRTYYSGSQPNFR